MFHEVAPEPGKYRASTAYDNVKIL